MLTIVMFTENEKNPQTSEVSQNHQIRCKNISVGNTELICHCILMDDLISCRHAGSETYLKDIYFQARMK